MRVQTVSSPSYIGRGIAEPSCYHERHYSRYGFHIYKGIWSFLGLDHLWLLTDIAICLRHITVPLGITLPTFSGSWITVFAAVIRAILSSMVFPPACKAEAERISASPTPFEEIAKLFNLLLSRDSGTDRLHGGQVFRPASHISR